MSGFLGTGLIIIDPETGAGGYFVSGGSNGAVLLLKIVSTIATVTSLALSIPSLGVGAIALGVTLGPWLTLIGFVCAVLLLWNDCADQPGQFNKFLLVRMLALQLVSASLLVPKLAGQALDLLSATLMRLTSYGLGSMTTGAGSDTCR